ncbi:hypothetical protein NQ318_000225 [Aromia moschata]|uniref:Transposase n=1 Tax=Aromia moschata TaxID=1265417 RepID=A0AAV8Y2S4_9CUCU|nr:hypothetical protein NQ318_000225 [Aromia moschata]
MVLRKLSQWMKKIRTGLSQSSIYRILKKEMLHPYHDTPVQQLLPQDLLASLQFVQFLQNIQTENPDFLNKIFLGTDEATFKRGGTICGIRRIHMLCTTHIRRKHVGYNIYMSIFLIGVLAVEVNMSGHQEVQA